MSVCLWIQRETSSRISRTEGKHSRTACRLRLPSTVRQIPPAVSSWRW